MEGAVFEDNREERIPGVTMGAVYNTERRFVIPREFVTL